MVSYQAQVKRRLQASHQEQLMKKGIIASHLGIMVLVEGPDQERTAMRVKRKSGLVVGDMVFYDEKIQQREDRKNVLARQTDFGMQEMAANLDVLAIVVAPFPKTPQTFIDLAIVAARHQGIRPAIVINKADLPEHEDYKSSLLETFGPFVSVFSTSTNTATGIDELRAFIKGSGRSLFIGVSGAGKSSLVNILVPAAKLDTGDHTPTQSHGKHVTTVSTMHRLEGDAFLIDTPGVRDFRIASIPPEDLALLFVGFEQWLQKPCRFRNCLHDHEPGCHIREAVRRGEIAASRYAIYLELLRESKAANQKKN